MPRQATIDADHVHGARSGKRPGRHPLMYVFGVFGFFIFLGVGYLYQLMNDPDEFPIERISVDGDFVHLDPTRVKVLVSNAVTGGFFSIDVENLRETISEHPWIFDASVRRVWPDTIRVSIREQRAVAVWGEHALLNERADIFAPEPSSFPTGLAKLSGPVGAENVVLETYERLQRAFAPLAIELKRIGLSDRNAWTVETADGVRLVLGRDNLEQKIARFQHAYVKALKAQWMNITRVDLRYTNGLTVASELSG